MTASASAVVDAPIARDAPAGIGSWLERQVWLACDEPRTLTDIGVLIEQRTPGYRSSKTALGHAALQLERRGHLIVTNPDATGHASLWMRSA